MLEEQKSVGFWHVLSCMSHCPMLDLLLCLSRNIPKALFELISVVLWNMCY
ncbi:LOW QUALITY PROTEIN: hypothetical protein TorRG33x02_169440 [Trema orientale]|uniref:Uncharacterized protein n=1 Tax=Trema orientale TaxID=63057 RepID=A0A2P5EP06_TREOI|nr:LOW QUALITY PROTEIN: hypothetical protein TorRG33x02_169440 [Trema orientale]